MTRFSAADSHGAQILFAATSGDLRLWLELVWHVFSAKGAAHTSLGQRPKSDASQ